MEAIRNVGADRNAETSLEARMEIPGGTEFTCAIATVADDGAEIAGYYGAETAIRHGADRRPGR
jgi:hypothetical protein